MCCHVSPVYVKTFGKISIHYFMCASEYKYPHWRIRSDWHKVVGEETMRGNKFQYFMLKLNKLNFFWLSYLKRKFEDMDFYY